MNAGNPHGAGIFNRPALVQYRAVPEHPVGKTVGERMRKGTIVIAALLAVGMTGTADAAKKKAAPAKPDPAVAAQQNTANLVGDAFQPWKPQRTMPKKK